MTRLKEILTELETADNANKNQLENELVNMGSQALPAIVEELQIVEKGLKRGILAMSLIRIGSEAISYLQQAANKNSEFKWVANYITNEIECTQVA